VISRCPTSGVIRPLLLAVFVAFAVGTSAADAPLRPDAKGFIRDWLLLAPIRLPAESATAEEIDRPQVPFEFALQPAAGEGITIYGKVIQWRAIRAKDFFFDVNEILGGAHEKVAAYAVAYVIAPREITGAQLLMGSNDQGKVWLNGKEVVKSTDARSLEPDTDKATQLTLKAGTNVVIFKVLNESNNWQGCLRFTDAAGQPIVGLTLKLAP
jgi:hypothetical protein